MCKHQLTHNTFMLNGQFLIEIENEQPLHVVVHLHVTTEESCCYAHTVDFAFHPIKFQGGIDWSALLRVVCFFCVSYPYVPRDAPHDFSFVSVCPERPMLSKIVTRMLKALCSQMGFRDPISPWSTKNATISLFTCSNLLHVASLSSVHQSYSLITTSTQTLNISLNSVPP